MDKIDTHFKKLPIFNDKERAELKEIMLEALAEFHNKPELPDYRPYAYRLDELQEWEHRIKKIIITSFGL